MHHIFSVLRNRMMCKVQYLVYVSLFLSWCGLRPAEDDLPGVPRIAEDLPVCISSDEEEDVDVEMDVEGEDILPPSDEDEESDEEEEEMDDSDRSDDSGYDSNSEDEEELEVDDVDDIRLRSPLVQQFPPANLWEGWHQGYPPVPSGTPAVHPVGVPTQTPDAAFVCGPVAVHQHLVVWQPPLPAEHRTLLGQQREPPEGHHSVSQRLGDGVPSISGLSSSTKRNREENPSEQVSAKRLRIKYEERLEVSAPSTSGLGLFTTRNRDESYRASAPSTSGVVSFPNIMHWPGPFGFPVWTDDNDSD